MGASSLPYMRGQICAGSTESGDPFLGRLWPSPHSGLIQQEAGKVYQKALYLAYGISHALLGGKDKEAFLIKTSESMTSK